ncbi:MAG TPA: aminotransferase class V-fold PLP-dependent enzyme [Anaerolineales bacterium]|nr:aminotransferase class V-fold PLP-dependent enzyme [Anaerolineales bacterium]
MSQNAPYSSQEFDQANKEFLQRYPTYAGTAKLDEMRKSDYTRLDQQQQIYLDYTGGGLHAESQVRQHLDLLTTQVFGNPHSHNPTSLAMTELVEEARRYVLDFFHAPVEEYTAIFTSNASGALKLVGESYPFTPGSHYVLAFDNHNSVNGIREFAKARGAKVTYVPVIAPELRLDMQGLNTALAQIDPNHANLFAFPAQSNFSGVQHPLGLIREAQQLGWDVLVDIAAFAPTNRFDVSHWNPDFAVLSFYKIFGYPTGLGCLLVRREKLSKLVRPWFAGGTITIASVQGNGHFLHDNEAGFEDGTVDYLNIPAVETGLRHIHSAGLDIIHERVMCLTGWLLDELRSLHHDNNQPLVHVHGPGNTEQRGGTITISVLDVNGTVLDDRRVEELANHQNISLRTGCFCNPGAGEIAHGLSGREMRTFFKQGQRISFLELRQRMHEKFSKNISSVRISTGIASNFQDVYSFMRFISGFLNKTAEEIGNVSYDAIAPHMERDTA